MALIRYRILVRANFCVFGGPRLIWLPEKREVNHDLRAVDDDNGLSVKMERH